MAMNGISDEAKRDGNSPSRQLFNDSLLVRLSKLQKFPLESRTHSVIAGISTLIWILIGYLDFSGDLSFSEEALTFLVILIPVAVFISSWVLSKKREEQSQKAFRMLNKCRKELLHIARFLGEKLRELDEQLIKLRVKGYRLPQDQLRDHYMLVDIKQAIEERSHKVKELLFSGLRTDLQSALQMLKLPYLVRQRAGDRFQLSIPLENLSATIFTVLESIEIEFDHVRFRQDENVPEMQSNNRRKRA